MGSATTIAEVLDRAADLIEPEGAWTQNEEARDALGYPVRSISAAASCWCIVGATFSVCRDLILSSDADSFLADTLPDEVGFGADVAEWNDTAGRTQAEVVAKLREAAALARGQGK